ncbi:hypothetical protein IW492_02695 [Enterococcus sp. BWB1-3]|uniref:hypothetical protein n=1 Tax=Enterococcus sp. BWB1-3 TaxID=2787713 RepID=UPI001924F65F|nr:hypothetical protein [Enterococcus sp. BWB1-3]MBL1228140.1 hypothetical protein [Enterococcus sp. BWB1-3]
MAKMGTVVTKGENRKQILANTVLFQAFGAQINDTDITADSNGRKIIPAGTPVGGADDFLDNEMAELQMTTNIEEIQGVLLYEVDVTAGTQNGTVLVFGFVNEKRLASSVEIDDNVKAALDGKITFVKRNA